MDKHGVSLQELQTASSLERLFYTASIIVMKKEKTENDIALAKLSNPFLEKK